MTQMNKRPPMPQRRPAQPGMQRPAAGQVRRAPQTAARRPVAPAKRSLLGGDLLKLLVGGIIVAVLAFVLQSAWPNGFPLTHAPKEANTAASAITEIHSEGPLRINEVMSRNQRTLAAEDGSSPDWIEVANIGGSAVNLSGYTLSKTTGGANTFTFPDMQLQSGECVVVLADSRLRAEAGTALHAPFRLSSSGDTLMLFNPGGTAIDTLNIPALAADISYARVDSAAWQSSAKPTPGLMNTEESYLSLTQPSGDSPVVVTELMSTNDSILPDENGQYYDYIELYNRSGEAVNLSGWHLSDDSTDPRKWSFPDVTLQAGQYLVVHASGLDRKADVAHLHTNFGLSSEGEQVVLSNAAGKVMDRVDFDLLQSNVAWTLNPDGSWGSSAAPSPGR